MSPISEEPLTPGHAFSDTERRAVYRAIFERRDMRRFVPGSTIPHDVLTRILRGVPATVFYGSPALSNGLAFVRDQQLAGGIINEHQQGRFLSPLFQPGVPGTINLH